MALCKKGYTMESKPCGISCNSCADYAQENKKQRQQKQILEHKEWVKQYVKTACPKTCCECALYTPKNAEWDGTIPAQCNGAYFAKSEERHPNCLFNKK